MMSHMGKWIIVIAVLAATVIGAEWARSTLPPDAQAVLSLGLGLAYGVGAAVLLGVVIRLWLRG
jgi:hypothetical protein